MSDYTSNTAVLERHPQSTSDDLYEDTIRNNKPLAGKVVENYKKNPITSTRRMELIKSGLEKLGRKDNIDLHEQHDTTRDEILNRYGERGLEIIKKMQGYIQKHSIESTVEKLTDLSGGLKYQVKKAVKEYEIDQRERQKCINEQISWSKEFQEGKEMLEERERQKYTVKQNAAAKGNEESTEEIATRLINQAVNDVDNIVGS